MEEQNGNREMKKTPAVRDVHDADDRQIMQRKSYLTSLAAFYNYDDT